jgi:hypothetical protein
MKQIEQAQIPAEGILKHADYGDSKFYRIACRCGNGDDDVQMNIEADDYTVTMHVWTTVKTDWWRRRFEDHDNFIVHYALQRLNGILNRVSVAWTALTKGYVEMESWTMLNRQEALNVANTIATAVIDVEEFDRQRREKKNK